MQTYTVFGSNFGANQHYVFTELPKADTVEAIEALLPGDLKIDQNRAG
jgi:hypothetical protein